MRSMNSALTLITTSRASCHHMDGTNWQPTVPMVSDHVDIGPQASRETARFAEIADEPTALADVWNAPRIESEQPR